MNKISSALLGILVLISFFSGFACLIIGGENGNTPLLTLGLGIMFFLPSICLLISKKLIALPFAILSLILISYSLSKWYGHGLVGDFLEKYAVLLFGLTFLIAGLWCFWATIGIRLWKRKYYCAVPVNIKVISTESETSYNDKGYTILHHSVYQYYYNGKEYTYDPKVFDNLVSHFGEFIAYVNPNNPSEIIIPLLKMPKTIITIISLISICSGLLCIFLFIKKVY